WKLTAKVGPDLYRCNIECLEPETSFGRFQRLCGTVLPLATEASAEQSITDLVEERIAQLREEIRAKLKGMPSVKRTPINAEITSLDSTIPSD
ncbi:hypothetical protein LINGRAHAP2_LOCUS3949, partial [Linum grandiflorum]